MQDRSMRDLEDGAGVYFHFGDVVASGGAVGDVYHPPHQTVFGPCDPEAQVVSQPCLGGCGLGVMIDDDDDDLVSFSYVVLYSQEVPTVVGAVIKLCLFLNIVDRYRRPAYGSHCLRIIKKYLHDININSGQ